MIRRNFLPFAVVAVFTIHGWSGLAFAQDEGDGEMTFEEDDGSEQADGQRGSSDDAANEAPPDDLGLDPDLALDGSQAKGLEKPVDSKLGADRVSWQDIVVVVRKPFLKLSRLEFMPTWGVTMNDNIIQHYQFAGNMNYYLTDVLSVGIEGQYFVKNLREPFDLVARQARRLPTVNKYKYGAALNFHYVPIYAKFAVFNEHVVHWESFFTAGVGFTQSEVLPRDPALLPFENFLITPNVGVAMRFFITRFLTVHLGVRDYIFLDKYEAANRMERDPDAAKAAADSALVNNVLFQAGISFWYPTSFRYTTFR
jgi:outer membrane beta-barrel protein